VIAMTMTPIHRHVEPLYAQLRPLLGTQVTVIASVLDGGGVVPLTVECLSDPVSWGGAMTYSLRLTGPVDRRLSPGRYEIVHAECSFLLSLFEVADEVLHVHYEAYLSEPV
jgi:hypothetical protein